MVVAAAWFWSGSGWRVASDGVVQMRPLTVWFQAWQRFSFARFGVQALNESIRALDGQPIGWLQHYSPPPEW